MKKIAKLTWLHNGNYGSILQAYALSHFLQEHGYEVVDIDYSASMKTKLINWWKNKNSPGLFLKKLEARKWKKKVDANLIQKRNELFDKFRTNELNLSKRCSTIEEIKQETNKFDVVICGSDQIWSPALLNPVYYLDMVSDKKKKIAYAPSFGVLEMTEKKRKQIIGYLKRIDYISVREYQGQELVKKLIGKEVPVLVDPTMLLPQNHWKRFSNNKVLDKPYLFVYLLTPNEKYINMVKQIAEQKNLDVVIVPTGKGPFDTGFIELFDIGPTEWISLIANASLVCTDSFHGCIFSSIFEKEFILFKRFSDTKKDSENSRVYTLVKHLGAEDRLIGEDDFAQIGLAQKLDYAKIKNQIGKLAETSGEWILQILSKECN